MTNYTMVCTPVTSTQAETASPLMTELSDEQLIARICKHDRAAFSCFLSRHLDAIHAYLYRLTGSRADADDLAQDTFLRVWRKANTFKPGRATVGTWLHRIAHNLCIDEFRKQRPGADVALDELVDPAAEPTSDYGHRDDLARLNVAMMELPESQRSALTLCQIQGFSNQDAADIMGIGVRALESLLARARRRLKRELSEQTHE